MIRSGDLERRTYQGLYHPICAKCDKLVDSIDETPRPWVKEVLLTIRCHGEVDHRLVTQDFIMKNERIIAFKPPPA